jgi:MoaA/NifB/PqqE/SkfB family radical SAM enzyme
MMPTSVLRPNQVNKYQACWEFAHAHADVQTTPPWVQIARSNLCNFSCVYCPDHRDGNEIPLTRTEGEAWEGLLALIPRSEMMAFHGVSEFMIDPDFFDIVNRCASARVMLSINTNGSVCTARHRDVLVSYPEPISLIFSIDAATPETYLHIRRWDFARVLQNVKSYVACLRPRPHLTFITLSFVITKSNVHEMAPFVLLGKSLGVDYVRFSRLLEYQCFDWRVETTPGRYFDYREECTGHFVEAYNRNVDDARKAAELSGMAVELPPPIAERAVEKVPT